MVEAQHRRSSNSGEAPGAFGVRQKHASSGIGRQLGDHRGRHLGIQRQVRRSRLPHAENGRDGIEPAFHRQPHGRSDGTGGQQAGGDGFGAPVELGVRHRYAIPAGKCDAAGVTLDGVLP